MEPDIERYYPFAKVGVPTVVSGCLLLLLWRDGELHGRRGAMLCLWFVVAVCLQVLATSPAWWATGLVAQALLAIVLVLKRKINRL
jgi:hypothetical protein